jgi:hypothetical protein
VSDKNSSFRAELNALYQDEGLRKDCSGFLKAAAAKWKPAIVLPDVNADKLIQHFKAVNSPWLRIGSGAQAGTEAANYAAKGHFVVAVLEAKDHLPFGRDEQGEYTIKKEYKHGHMAVVLGGATKQGYPYLVSGGKSVDGQSDGSKSVLGEVWRRVDAPKVEYFRYSGR